MKTAIKALFATIGLAPSGQAQRVTIELQQAIEKISTLEERLVQARADAESWKRRHENAVSASTGWKKAAAASEADLARARADGERAKAELERLKADSAPGADAAAREIAQWKGRAEKLAAEVQDLRTRLDTARGRLDETQHVASTAREQLMAMEVKLDLIESAIQVLDTRTREAAVSRT